ncbi:tRNA pseudouridine(55) synthase TruB [Candidatus Saccharibacteria bacterium CG10_big_fil_rev_8_21_14_0_10_47_8]|nr:MAG: tRNA pseudouridine(55) synthase TruB [Candidatus Saccharibacteria bacterium CG10_big_fil_rev_8_21_14_0_10_47_8]
MDGILLVDKPAGWTSHDVVAKVRSILRQAQSSKLKAESSDKKPLATSFQLSASSQKVKVGHTGTLDPFATGLLILVVGSYTKRAAEFSKLDKTYEAEVTLGKTSTTGDPEGMITGYSGQVTGDSEKPSGEQVKAVLRQFKGKYMQMPPAYSAKKVDGQRAYKLARAGKEVKLEPVEVTVHRLQVTEYKYPKLKLIAEVSSGTYIRTLTEDIGQKLGTSAYLSALRRTEVGSFNVKDAINLEELTPGTVSKL